MPLRILGLAILALLVGLAPLTRAMAAQQPAYAALEAGCDGQNAVCAQACERAAARGAEDLQAPAPAGDGVLAVQRPLYRASFVAVVTPSSASLAAAGPPAYLRYHRFLL